MTALRRDGWWKDRVEDPCNRLYRYPVAHLLVRALVKTPIEANHVTLVQPFLAAVAGYLIATGDRAHMVMGALIFEVRSVLDCADGSLARAKKHVTPTGHALDGIADWIATALLYAGIFWHFHRCPPPAGVWSRFLSVPGVILLVLAQAGLRSFAADHFKLRYAAIFEEGHDAGAHPLDWIGRAGHLAFDRRGRPDCVARLRERSGSRSARVIAALWSVSNGDAFLSMVMLSILADRLWEAQLFFAIVGLPWIAAVIWLSERFCRDGAIFFTPRGRASAP